MAKLTLSKETLRRLSQDAVDSVRTGVPVPTYTCLNCYTEVCADADDTHHQGTVTKPTGTTLTRG
jgi:hypothetical protein